MKQKKYFVKKLVILAVALSLCITTMQISAQETENNHSSNLVPIDTTHLQREKQQNLDTHLVKTKGYQEMLMAPLNADTEIFSSENELLNPTLAANGNDILAVAEEYLGPMETNLVAAYSDDAGITWSETYSIAGEGSQTHATIDYCHTSDFEAYGTCVPDYNNKELWFLHFPSMTDPTQAWGDSEGWTTWSITLSSIEFYDIGIAGYPHGVDSPAEEFHGVVTLISNGDYGEQIENFYETTEGGIGACYLGFTGQLGDTVSVAMDPISQTYYEVMELRNDPDYPIEDGIFFEYCWLEPGNADWWLNDWPGFIVEGASNPALASYNNEVYLVYELDGAIVCEYSSDAGETFNSITIATAGEHPEISIVGDKVLCSYVSGNDVYTAISENSGASWTADAALNDEAGSVVSQPYALGGAGPYVAWTDDRNGVPTVFFDQAIEVLIPIIEIDNVAGGFGFSADILNSGNAAASNVEWSITFDGGVFFGGDAEGTITTLAPESSETVSSSFLFGFGGTEITVRAGVATESVTANVLLFFVTGL